MKIRNLKDVSPIHVMPGDSIVARYEERDHHGRLVRREEVKDTFTDNRVVDRIAIVELEKPELKQLGMKQAVAGVFGKRK